MLKCEIRAQKACRKLPLPNPLTVCKPFICFYSFYEYANKARGAKLGNEYDGGWCPIACFENPQ